MNKISILIPVYNGSAFLAECIESIIAQTETDWEALIINDFSTDNTLEILNVYTKKDSRIQVFNNENNKGIIGALQTAYSKSTGNFVTRMDADDIMTSDKLACLKNILLDKGTGTIAVGQVRYFSANGVGNGYKRYEEWLNKLTASNTNFSELYKECVIPSPAWMCWRSDFEICGAFQFNIYPEDYDLAFRFRKVNLQCFGTKKAVHFWRDYSSRTSRTDDNYADNRFIHIKVKYFLELDFQSDKELYLWGVGKKGKAIAKLLNKENIPFNWICNNEHKIGHNIYGKIVCKAELLPNKNAQYIIAVAGNEAQKSIAKKMALANIERKDCYYFC